ncbi:RNA polymerase sigma factor FliA [Motiliproteus sp. SC1-56]|uniref:RNA polymerase sigma factor FliA n=1 Tax=Motiliproteus sp. SC1-56 TaxID=2799565 RepID=UPI001A9052AF|nr:RNA polymerase sigma factor FliA [Motiliproteus sp. SC1-56]
MYNQLETGSPVHAVEKYAPLVKRIAHHMLARLPSSVILEDLIQSGMIGLLEAARKYDPSKGASFETYAGIRIRGAIIDEVRRGDWTPRSVHRNGRRIAECIQAVEARTGRDAQDAEVARELGVSLQEYYALLKDSAGSRLFSFDELQEAGENSPGEEVPSGEPGPERGHESAAFQQALAQAISQLPERERLVLSLYYDEELNLKEIGGVLGVSESRVSQIHSQAALRLRSRLATWR